MPDTRYVNIGFDDDFVPIIIETGQKIGNACYGKAEWEPGDVVRATVTVIWKKPEKLKTDCLHEGEMIDVTHIATPAGSRDLLCTYCGSIIRQPGNKVISVIQNS